MKTGLVAAAVLGLAASMAQAAPSQHIPHSAPPAPRAAAAPTAPYGVAAKAPLAKPQDAGGAQVQRYAGFRNF